MPAIWDHAATRAGRARDQAATEDSVERHSVMVVPTISVADSTHAVRARRVATTTVRNAIVTVEATGDHQVMVSNVGKVAMPPINAAVDRSKTADHGIAGATTAVSAADQDHHRVAHKPVDARDARLIHASMVHDPRRRDQATTKNKGLGSSQR